MSPSPPGGACGEWKVRCPALWLAPRDVLWSGFSGPCFSLRRALAAAPASRTEGLVSAGREAWGRGLERTQGPGPGVPGRRAVRPPGRVRQVAHSCPAGAGWTLAALAAVGRGLGWPGPGLGRATLTAAFLLCAPHSPGRSVPGTRHVSVWSRSGAPWRCAGVAGAHPHSSRGHLLAALGCWCLCAQPWHGRRDGCRLQVGTLPPVHHVTSTKPLAPQPRFPNLCDGLVIVPS